MNTSLKEWSAYAAPDTAKLSDADKAYFRANTRRRAYEVVLEKFMQRADEEKLTRADLARKLGASPAQVTRWLSSPSNWTLDTFSDLLLALSCTVRMAAEEIDNRKLGNYAHPFSTVGRDQPSTPASTQSGDPTIILELVTPNASFKRTASATTTAS